MEKLREALLELDSVDPLEWHNIPRPIVQGILALKTCTRLQSSFLDSFQKHFQDFEARCNVRIVNVQKAISDCSEKIQENKENTNSLLIVSDEKHKQTIADFQKKVTEEIRIDKVLSNEKFEEIREVVSNCHKRIDSMPTISQIQAMVNTVSDKVKSKLKKELKEDVVNPEVYALNQKIHLLNV